MALDVLSAFRSKNISKLSYLIKIGNFLESSVINYFMHDIRKQALEIF